jgi:3,4-dihydroxy 2-butanone 4-phosphate synthase / GTP cyclohydrolase II
VIISTTVLETSHGRFRVSSHGVKDNPERCLTIAQGDVTGPGTALRIHSSCVFGEALLASDCDCGQQLSTAMEEINRRGRGAVVYLYQEGRGAGIDLKIKGMERQRTQGVNSYESYASLGLPPDLRDYWFAGTALEDLGFAKRITLMSNNPSKRKALEELGYVIESQIALSYEVSRRAYNYLLMKQNEGRHTLDFSKISFVG